jgi:Tfp pilus assembly protein PilW
MLVELMVAIAILLIALFPLISSFIGIHKSVRI